MVGKLKIAKWCQEGAGFNIAWSVKEPWDRERGFEISHWGHREYSDLRLNPDQYTPGSPVKATQTAMI